MFQKLLWWAFSLRVAMCDCHNEIRKANFERGKSFYEISKIGVLPPHLRETSGLAKSTDTTYWTHNDGGNPNEIYEINQTGSIIKKLSLPFPNIDWEDLAQDTNGNLYVADVGNNFHQRKDLKLYQFNPANPTLFNAISIKYAAQTSFPAPKNMRYFDCEAVVWHRQKLYLFSKNWTAENKYVKLYNIPAQAGSYTLTPVDSIYSKSMVTAADISPDGQTLALLTYGKILFFDVKNGINFRQPTYCVKIGKGQAEAILFINNSDLLITNEDRRGLYLVKRKPNQY